MEKRICCGREMIELDNFDFLDFGETINTFRWICAECGIIIDERKYLPDYEELNTLLENYPDKAELEKLKNKIMLENIEDD